MCTRRVSSALGFLGFLSDSVLYQRLWRMGCWSLYETVKWCKHKIYWLDLKCFLSTGDIAQASWFIGDQFSEYSWELVYDVMLAARILWERIGMMLLRTDINTTEGIRMWVSSADDSPGTGLGVCDSLQQSVWLRLFPLILCSLLVSVFFNEPLKISVSSLGRVPVLSADRWFVFFSFCWHAC